MPALDSRNSLTYLINKARDADLTTEEMLILRKLLNRLLQYVDEEIYTNEVRGK